MNKINKFIDNARQQPWTIRIIDKGDAYGRNDCLTHDKDEPLVEFYDGDNPFDTQESDGTMLGQFVSRYNLSTICDGGRGGLDLMGYEPKWKIDYTGMDYVRSYLTAWAESMNYSWVEDGPYSTDFNRGNIDIDLMLEVNE
jgi:hypothetical protein